MPTGLPLEIQATQDGSYYIISYMPAHRTSEFEKTVIVMGRTSSPHTPSIRPTLDCFTHQLQESIDTSRSHRTTTRPDEQKRYFTNNKEGSEIEMENAGTVNPQHFHCTETASNDQT